ncbi:MAG: hypothetical protein Q9227_000619 [Pyrenula ochraceoflavens]
MVLEIFNSYVHLSLIQCNREAFDHHSAGLVLTWRSQEKRPLAAPTSHEVQIAVKATGLCGSDLHYYQHGRNGNFVVQSPLVLGHESAGVVTKVPAPITMNGSSKSTTPSSESSSDLKVGDRVALEVGIPCRACSLCAVGRYNLCPSLVFRSSAKTFPHADGTLQRYINHPASMCHKLPMKVSFEQGALVEPLAVALHGISRSIGAGSGEHDNPAGTAALVIGAGAVGLLVSAALAVHGVADIVIADISAARLAIAEKLGQDPKTGYRRFSIRTVLLDKLSPTTNTDTKMSNATYLAGVIKETTSPSHGFPRVFECTGLESCVQLGIFSASTGGKLMLVGMGQPIQTLNISAAALREVDIVGVFRYANQYPRAIRLFASGQLDGVAELLCTHKVALEEAEKAFDISAKGQDEAGNPAVKVLVEA